MSNIKDKEDSGPIWPFRCIIPGWLIKKMLTPCSMVIFIEKQRISRMIDGPCLPGIMLWSTTNYTLLLPPALFISSSSLPSITPSGIAPAIRASRVKGHWQDPVFLSRKAGAWIKLQPCDFILHSSSSGLLKRCQAWATRTERKAEQMLSGSGNAACNGPLYNQK